MGELSLAARKLAAKFKEDRYHPLICHMIDVASVAESMWQERMSSRQQGILCDGLGLSTTDAGRWVGLFAGLHDIGKASRHFQAKDPYHSARLAGTGLTVGVGALDPGHGLISAAQLPPLLIARGLGPRLASRVSVVVGGHHGTFPVLNGRGKGTSIGEEDPSVRTAWERVRAELFDALWNVIEPGTAPTGALPNPASLILAGIISVTDWIGSNENYFDWCAGGADELRAYREVSRQEALKALTAIHWDAFVAAPSSGARSFQSLFGNAPRPLQEAAEAVAADSREPALVIIEAPMGEGKTEAALLIADRWADGGYHGAYVGLPTQATANQLHRRMADYLSRRWPHRDVSLVLAHGGAAFRDTLVLDEGSDFVPSAVGDDEGEREGAVAAGEWFIGRKRALLSPYGVGTVDQSLMAILQVKHGFVRLFGLAGKVVVVDEVHAYDTYMTGLLERLLEWLAALGSPVVLLSATLPASRRVALLRAYDRGLRAMSVSVVEDVNVGYPRITSIDGKSIQATVSTFAAAPRSHRELRLNGRLGPSVEAVRDLLVAQLAVGGCAAVICNTVARAQEMYSALKDVFTQDELGLFHARFLLDDRQRIEEDCLRRLGPNDGSGRPQRYVLVATQVIEQSLDLDFDIMVSDFAPVDLLLQRSGRLQRHERGLRSHPLELHIRWPRGDDVPEFDPGSKAVYEEHILLRTWWLLRDRESVAIPSDLQMLVDAVYTDDEAVPEGIDGPLEKAWQRTWAEMRRKQKAEREEAFLRRIPPPWSHGSVTEFTRDPRDEDASDLHPALQALTRLVAPSVSVVVLSPGDVAIASHVRPSRQETRRLMGRSVSVTTQGLVQALNQLPPPASWQDSPWLRRHRLLVIGDDPNRAIPGYAISYDRELGLVLERR